MQTPVLSCTNLPNLVAPGPPLAGKALKTLQIHLVIGQEITSIPCKEKNNLKTLRAGKVKSPLIRHHKKYKSNITMSFKSYIYLAVRLR